MCSTWFDPNETIIYNKIQINFKMKLLRIIPNNSEITSLTKFKFEEDYPQRRT